VSGREANDLTQLKVNNQHGGCEVSGVGFQPAKLLDAEDPAQFNAGLFCRCIGNDVISVRSAICVSFRLRSTP